MMESMTLGHTEFIQLVYGAFSQHGKSYAMLQNKCMMYVASYQDMLT